MKMALPGKKLLLRFDQAINFMPQIVPKTLTVWNYSRKNNVSSKTIRAPKSKLWELKVLRTTNSYKNYLNCQTKHNEGTG